MRSTSPSITSPVVGGFFVFKEDLNDDLQVSRAPAGDPDDTGNKDLVDRIQAAQAHPLAESFTNSVERLASMAERIGGRARLYLDFAPLSLGWAVMRADGFVWMCGGLIFSSNASGLGTGGAPSFSVSLSGEDGWSLRS